MCTHIHKSPISEGSHPMKIPWKFLWFFSARRSPAWRRTSPRSRATPAAWPRTWCGCAPSVPRRVERSRCWGSKHPQKWWIYGDLMVFVGKNGDFDGMDTTINDGSMVILWYLLGKMVISWDLTTINGGSMVDLWWIYGDFMVFVGKNGDFMGFNHYKWWIYGDLMVMIMVIYVGKIVILMGWIPLYMVDLWWFTRPGKHTKSYWTWP